MPSSNHPDLHEPVPLKKARLEPSVMLMSVMSNKPTRPIATSIHTSIKNVSLDITKIY